jgi:hypothetical protein
MDRRFNPAKKDRLPSTALLGAARPRRHWHCGRAWNKSRFCGSDGPKRRRRTKGDRIWLLMSMLRLGGRPSSCR